MNLEVIRHGSLQNIEFFQRISFLCVHCTIVGVLLPLLFERVLDSFVLLLATKKGTDYNHSCIKYGIFSRSTAKGKENKEDVTARTQQVNEK